MTKYISSKKELFEARKKIDQLDDQIINLLEKRFALIQAILKEKKDFTDRKREKEILSKTQNGHIRLIYFQIFKESKKIFLKNLQSKQELCDFDS